MCVTQCIYNMWKTISFLQSPIATVAPIFWITFSSRGPPICRTLSDCAAQVMLLTQCLLHVTCEQVRRELNRPTTNREHASSVHTSFHSLRQALLQGYFTSNSTFGSVHISSSDFQECTGFVLFLSWDLLLPRYQFMLFMLFVHVILSYYIPFWRHSINKQSFTTVSLWRVDSFLKFSYSPFTWYCVYGFILFILCHRMEGCRNVYIVYGHLSHSDG